MRSAEIIAGGVLLAAAALLVREALRLPVGWTGVGPGAGFFPFWLSVGVAVCALVVFAQSVRAPAPASPQPFVPRRAWKPLLAVFLPMAAIIAFMGYFGIYLGGAIYLAGYMWLVGRFRWPVILAVSVLIPLALFVVFERWFLLLLPKGILLEYLLYGR